jgi:hypothetical protein
MDVARASCAPLPCTRRWNPRGHSEVIPRSPDEPNRDGESRGAGSPCLCRPTPDTCIHGFVWLCFSARSFIFNHLVASFLKKKIVYFCCFRASQPAPQPVLILVPCIFGMSYGCTLSLFPFPRNLSPVPCNLFIYITIQVNNVKNYRLPARTAGVPPAFLAPSRQRLRSAESRHRTRWRSCRSVCGTNCAAGTAALRKRGVSPGREIRTKTA